MPKKIKIDLELETKKALKKIKKLEKEIEKSIGRKREIDIVLDGKKAKKQIKEIVNNKEKQKLLLEPVMDLEEYKKSSDNIEKLAEDTKKKIESKTKFDLKMDIVDLQEKIKRARKNIKLFSHDAEKQQVLNLNILDYQQKLRQARADLRNFGKTGKKSIGIVRRGIKKVGWWFGKMGLAIQGIKSTIGNLGGGFSSFSNSFTNMQNSLRQVADGKELDILQGKIHKAANSSRTDVESYAKAFARFDKVNKAIGGTTEETLTIMDSLSKGLSATGAETSEVNSVMLQLSQAFGSGKLAGDEFRSVSENMPILLDILAEKLGVERGELKELASQGKITSKVLKEALIGANEKMNESFDKSKITISQAGTVMRNDLIMAFGELDKKTGITTKIATGIVTISKSIVGLVKSISSWSEKNPKLASTLSYVAIGLTSLLGILGIYSVSMGIATWATGAFVGVLALLTSPITLIIGAIAALALAFSTDFLGIKTTVMEWYNYLESIFGDKIRSMFDSFMEFLSAFADFFMNIFNSIVDFFTGSTEEMGAIGKVFSDIFNSIWETIKWVFEQIVGFIKMQIENIKLIFNSFTKILKGDFKGAFEDIKKVFGNFLNFFGNFFGDIASTGAKMAGDLANKAIDWGFNLIKSIGDGIKNGIKWVKDQGKAVANALFRLLGVNSPTKEGPLAVDQRKWGMNLIKAIGEGIQKARSFIEKPVKKIAGYLQNMFGKKIRPKLRFGKTKIEIENNNWEKLFGEDIVEKISKAMKSKIPEIRKAGKQIKKELEEIAKLQTRFKTNKAVSNRISKLNKKLETIAFGTEDFENIKKELELLAELKKKYSGEKIKYEENLGKIKEKLFKKSFEFIKKEEKEKNNLEKSNLKQFQNKKRAIEKLIKLQKTINLTEEQQIKISEKIGDYKRDIGKITENIFKKEEQALKKLSDGIEKLKKEKEKLTDNKDKSIAERKLDIEKERKKILEDIIKLEKPGAIMDYSVGRVKKIDEELEGSISENNRNRLLKERESLLKNVGEQIMKSNSLSGEAYELKKKLQELDKEEKIADTSIEERKLSIQKEKLAIAERIKKLEEENTTDKTKVENIDDYLEKNGNNVSEEDKNFLLEQRTKILDRIAEKLKKIKTLETKKEELDPNLVDNARENQKKSKTEKILDTFKDKKKKIDNDLKLKIEAINKEKKALEDILKIKEAGEIAFTKIVKLENKLRITEMQKMLSEARSIATQMANLGFNGKGFKATFEKTDKDGKISKITKTVNTYVTNNIKTQEVDGKKIYRDIVRFGKRAERTGNKV